MAPPSNGLKCIVHGVQSCGLCVPHAQTTEDVGLHVYNLRLLVEDLKAQCGRLKSSHQLNLSQKHYGAAQSLAPSIATLSGQIESLEFALRRLAEDAV